jgi:hypothetical protein
LRYNYSILDQADFHKSSTNLLVAEDLAFGYW